MSRRSFALAGLGVCAGAGLVGWLWGRDAGSSAASPCAPPTPLGPPSGDSVWPVPFRMDSAPPVAAGTFLYGANADGTVQAWDARTGRRLWRHATPAVAGAGTGGTFPAPVTTATSVFAGFGYGPLEKPAGNVTAVCAANGHRLWQRPFNDYVVELAYASGLTIAVTHTALYALAAASGRPVWRAPVFQARGLSPQDDMLVMSTAGGDPDWVIALNPVDGSRRWAASFSNAGLVQFTVNGDLVHASTIPRLNAEKGEVRALSRKTGHPEWSRSLELNDPTALSDGDLLYVPSGDRLLALRTTTGETEWSLGLPEPGLVPKLQVHDGLLLVSVPVRDTGDGLFPLLGVDARSGERRWRLGLEDPAVEIPPFSAGAAFITTAQLDGGLVAVDLNAGELIWKAHVPKSAPLVVGDELLYLCAERITAYDSATGRPV